MLRRKLCCWRPLPSKRRILLSNALDANPLGMMATGRESEIFLFRRHSSASSQQRWKGRVRRETNKNRRKKEWRGWGGGSGIRERRRLKTTRSRKISPQSAADDGDLTSMLGKAFVSARFKFGDGLRPDCVAPSVVLYVWEKSDQSSIYLSSASDTFISIRC